MDMREGLAASIVAQYPKFKDSTDPHKRPWVSIGFDRLFFSTLSLNVFEFNYDIRIHFYFFQFLLQWRIFDRLGRTGPTGWIANASINIMRSVDSKDRPRGGGSESRRRKPTVGQEPSQPMATNYEDPNVSNYTVDFCLTAPSICKNILKESCCDFYFCGLKVFVSTGEDENPKTVLFRSFVEDVLIKIQKNLKST